MPASAHGLKAHQARRSALAAHGGKQAQLRLANVSGQWPSVNINLALGLSTLAQPAWPQSSSMWHQKAHNQWRQPQQCRRLASAAGGRKCGGGCLAWRQRENVSGAAGG